MNAIKLDTRAKKHCVVYVCVCVCAGCLWNSPIYIIEWAVTKEHEEDFVTGVHDVKAGLDGTVADFCGHKPLLVGLSAQSPSFEGHKCSGNGPYIQLVGLTDGVVSESLDINKDTSGVSYPSCMDRFIHFME